MNGRAACQALSTSGRVRRVFGQLAPGELSAVSDGLALFLGFGDRLEPERH